jgi:hypothetical protein
MSGSAVWMPGRSFTPSKSSQSVESSDVVALYALNQQAPRKQVPFDALRGLRAGSHRAFGSIRNDIITFFTEMSFWRRNPFRRGLGQHVSNAPDLCADAFEFLFNFFIAAINVIDAVDDRLSIGDERGENERC